MGRSQCANRKLIHPKLSLILVALIPGFVVAAPPAPTSLPTDGQVVSGQASIVQSSTKMTVNQSTSQAIINWNTFNIGSQAAVNFNQPASTSVVLNRVLSTDPSSIFGTLSANGRVFLINPSGVVFGSGSSVNTAGLVVSTLSISDSDFLSGNYRFNRNGATGGIVNQGTLAADNGFIALLAPQISNEGIIRANLGTVALAAGETVTLSLDAANRLNIAVEPSTIKTLIENKQLIQADGGTVIMTSSAASNLLGSVITNTGIIEANSMGLVNGQVVLSAENGTTLVSGTGRIEAQGTSTGQTGGTVKLLGDHVGLFDSASINVSGDTGGGTALIGGNFQGQGPERNASAVFMSSDAVVTLDAVTAGNGGRVVLWSDGFTSAHGTIYARGGAQSGDGGLIETSGHQVLDTTGIRGSAGAANGKGGSWLFDPDSNVTINTTATAGGLFAAGTFTPTADSSNILNTDINALLNGGTNVTVTTSNAAGTQAGDINVNASITKSAGGNASLAFRAHNSIILASGVSISSSSGAMDVTLNSDMNAIGLGAIKLSTASIVSNGGNILLAGGVNAAASAVGEGSNANGILLDAATLRSGAGSITLRGRGQTLSSSARGVDVVNSSLIQSTSGAITIVATGGGAGTSNSNDGVRIFSGSDVSSAGGAITLTGTGGAGNIFQSGIVIGAGTTVSSINGPISITGTGTGSIAFDRGILIQNGANITSTGTATITISGTGGAGSSGSNQGVVLEFPGTTVSSSTGAISITGTGAGSGAGNNGVLLNAGGQVRSIGAAPITITGAGAAGAAAVQMSGGGNSIGGATATGDITLTGIAGGMTLADTIRTTGNVSITTPGPISQGAALTVGGNLTVNNAAAISQSAPITVSGTSSFSAGANPITLTNAGNDFVGAVSLTGGTTAITDANALTFGTLSTGGLTTINTGALNLGTGMVSGALTSTSNGGAVSQSGPLTVTGAANVQAGAGSITLANASNDFVGAVTAGGTGISFTDVNAFTPAIINAGTGSVMLTAGTINTNPGGSVTGASGTLSSANTVGTSAANSLVVNFQGTPLLLTGNASTWNLSGPPTQPVFSVTNPSTNILYNGAAISGAAPMQQTIASPTQPPIVDAVTRTPPPSTPLPDSDLVIAPQSEQLSFDSKLTKGSALGGMDIAERLLDLADDDAARRRARGARYKVAIEILRKSPTAADLPLCGGSASEVCISAKPGVVSDVAQGAAELSIPATEIKRKVAFLIGNSAYRGQIPVLDTPVGDVQALGKTLNEKFGYEVNYVENGSKADIVRALNGLVESTSRDESVLIFYAGHGYQMEDSKAGFWLPVDATASDPRTWISNNDVQRFLNRVDAKQIMIVSDSCFSGTLTKEEPVDAPKAAPKEQLLSRRAVVAMSSGDEEPVADAGLGGHSVFTYYFLKALAGVRQVSPVSALYDRLKFDVQRAFPQTPQLGVVTSAGHMHAANYLFELK
jgi:filamentous hemagglutinin family protein